MHAACRSRLGEQQLRDAGVVQVGIGRQDARQAGALACIRAHDDRTGPAAVKLVEIARIGDEGEVTLARSFRRRDGADACCAVADALAAQTGNQFVQANHAQLPELRALITESVMSICGLA